MKNKIPKHVKVLSMDLLFDFPDLETMMFKNKSAIRLHKKKKNYKNKPK